MVEVQVGPRPMSTIQHLRSRHDNQNARNWSQDHFPTGGRTS